jgi:hypothetical protein
MRNRTFFFYVFLYVKRWRLEEQLHRHPQPNCYLGVLNAIDLAMAPRGITFHNDLRHEIYGSSWH